MAIFSKLIGGISKNKNTIGNALGTLGSMLSPAVGAGLSYKHQNALMEKQQNWLEHMSNTAYQRQVQDLVQAGINPLYGLSGGASTPAASLASAPDYASAFSMGNQNRLANQLNKAQIENLDSQALLNQVNSVKQGYESDLTFKELENYDKRFQANLDLLGAQAFAALQSGSASSAQASYYQSMKLGQDIDNLFKSDEREFRRSFYDFANSDERLKKSLSALDYILDKR